MPVAPIKIQGSLQDSSATIYTTPKGKRALITSIIYSNTINTAYTLILSRSLANGSNVKQLYAINLNAGEFVVDDGNYAIGADNSLTLSSTGGNIDYTINGEEFDA